LDESRKRALLGEIRRLEAKGHLSAEDIELVGTIAREVAGLAGDRLARGPGELLDEAVLRLNDRRKLNDQLVALSGPMPDGDPGGLDPGGWSSTPLLSGLQGAGWNMESKSVVKMGSVLRRKDSSFPGGTVGELPATRAPFVELTVDKRYVYPKLQQGSLGEDLAITEYVESAAPTVTGSIERDPLATTDKATMDVAFDYVAEKAKQLAVVVENLPAAILTSFPTFAGVINSRMQGQLDQAADEHVLSQIDAAGPDSGGTGADTIADLRNGVAAMRDAGCNPTIAAINPLDMAALDLTSQGADQLYLFSLRSTGGASPLFGLSFTEAKNVPQGWIYLIDPNVIGVFYVGPSRFQADPYTQMKKNLVGLRLEQVALFHVRNISGAYIVGGGS
jgi:hypothetical protein